MSVLLWWLALFGLWPLVDPGHDDLSSPLVWIDLAIHCIAAAVLIHRWREKVWTDGYQVGFKAAPLVYRCGLTDVDSTGKHNVCDRPHGHAGWHVGETIAWNAGHRR